MSLEWEGGGASAEIRTAGGYQACVPPEAHFGLGPVAALKKVRVRWPDGALQDFDAPGLDRMLLLEERAP